MQKEDGLGEEDVSMRRPLSDGTLSESNHHQNGHMIDSNGVNMSKSHSESAQSAVINILGNASLNTDLHIEEVDFSRSDKLNATMSEAHSTQHQNGGDGLKMNSHLKNGGSEINSEFSNTSQQLLKHPVEGVFANAQTASKIDDIDGRIAAQSDDPLNQSIVYDKSMEQQQQSPQIEQTCSAGLNDPLVDGGIIDDIPNESPASPEPMRELTWLPPLYVPEIPLSTGDNERVTSPESCRAPPPSYEDDPQMMQAVIDLSATVDAKKLSAPPRKPPPLVPVPIEPHSVVRTYDRTPPCFSRSAYAKRNTAVATSWKHRDREHHQKQPQSSGNAASVGTSNETVKRHSSNPNIAHEPSTSATQRYSTHDSMVRFDFESFIVC
ncbi:unnamed protein product [Anisakis simplex]|uniref:Uncharacterized protein n=1 Tax=Anisakis simplex TaxID=6269 RepID=A0A0M3KBS8_ANISI|nr:unnamed protein product [Anisakis simplex]